ncbi:MAG TPA: TolC family protein, partial [Polyangiaceae bacterium]|nr:TolC family protein [Polyangiaceae bacterium]
QGSAWGFTAGVSDQGLIEGLLSRKRALRENVAKKALEAARFGRADAERLIVAQTKINYIELAAAAERLEFTRKVAESLKQSAEVNRARYPQAIDEGALARTEQEALRADQNVAKAQRDLREQQIELAFFLGVRGEVPDFNIDRSVLKFQVPPAIGATDKGALLRTAWTTRPDFRAIRSKEDQAEAQIALVRRQRFPDVSLSVNYSQLGGEQASPAPVSPPTLGVTATFPLPIFYQLQGELRRAEADREAAAVARRKLEAQVSADLESAYNAFAIARGIVERYEKSQLDLANRAQEITRIQYKAGSATLTDLLDAQRSYFQVNSDYYDELVNYWTAVFTLEQAIGKELMP